jgi:hypothetical protein
MRVVIQLRLEEALALQTGQSSTPELQQVLRTIQELGGDLRPVHPGSTGSLLAPYFVVDVPNRLVADQLIARLLTSSAVSAAYIEPEIEAETIGSGCQVCGWAANRAFAPIYLGSGLNGILHKTDGSKNASF